TVVEGTTARSEISLGGKPTQKSDSIDKDAILLNGSFFGPYEALAIRVRTATPGSTIPAYLAPQTRVTIRVGESSAEQIQTPGKIVNAHRISATLVRPSAPPLDAEIWTDDGGHLLRFSMPAQNVEVVRED